VLCANDASVSFDDAWTELAVRANLPSKDYLEANGPAPAIPDDRRRFVRFRCRGRAILQRGADRMAAYTADLSRAGIGIISPVQLFPRQAVHIATSGQTFHLVVVWCLKLGKDCYQCGCQFEQRQSTSM
jgi:hypothetical protein